MLIRVCSIPKATAIDVSTETTFAVNLVDNLIGQGNFVSIVVGWARVLPFCTFRKRGFGEGLLMMAQLNRD
jgi:hypothetical protein